MPNDNLILSHDAVHWHGTFIVTAMFMLRELLSDGLPVATIVVEVETSNTTEPQTHTGLLTEVWDNGTLVFEDLPNIRLDNVLSVEVP